MQVESDRTVMTSELKERDLRWFIQNSAWKVMTSLRDLYLRHVDVMSIAVLIGFAASMLVIGQVRPIYNWDALAYLAASTRDQFDDISQLHTYVYSVLREAAPPAEFLELTSANAYRIRQFGDAEAFVSMLGMYEVKWLYIQLLRWLIPIFGPLGAPDAINGVALLILAGSIGVWLRSAGLSGYAPLVVALLFVLQLQGFAGTQQPDFLANSLLVASLLSYERDRNLLGSLFLLISVLTRPDQLALAGVLMTCAWFLRDRHTLLFAATFLVGVFVWILISRSVHSVGWWPHFWFSTYEIQGTMVGFEPDFSPRVYIAAIASNLYRSLFLNTWLSVYVIALGWGLYRYFHAASSVRSQVLLLTMLLAVAAKFAVFPLHDGRIYFAPLLVFFLVAFAHPQRKKELEQKQP